MGGVNETNPSPLERAIKAADGMTALARKLTERGHEVKDHRTVYQWTKTRVPAEYCPDIEALTGIPCEQLRPDVNWAVLRSKRKAKQPAAQFAQTPEAKAALTKPTADEDDDGIPYDMQGKG